MESASLTDALEIYRDYADNVQAVFHCWPYDLNKALPIFELGGLISFTGVATFKNAQHVLETTKNTPAGSFMVETDAPYLAPVPHRGKRNEPAFTRNTADAIASARSETIDQLAKHTEATAQSFFRFS